MFLFHLVLLTIATTVSSSWFSSEPDFAKWSQAELQAWLEYHNIKVPPSFEKSHLYDLVNANWHSLPSARQWSFEQYAQAQHAFQHVKEDTFDLWDESKLRAFLLEHGVVAPSGPREQLVLLAKQKYRTYTDAAALYSSLASGSISSAYAGATDTVSSASQSITSTIAQATDEVARALDDTKDYVYSAWDDARLRGWLEDHGVIQAKSLQTRNELIKLANDYSRKASFTVWENWSDSYIRDWLIAHHLLKPSDTTSRSSLLEQMKQYYYRCEDNVWNMWSDSELKSWLVGHHFLSGDAQKSRDELIKMVEDHYTTAADSIWGAWSDSEIRQWLSENGYLADRSDIKERKDLVHLINSSYHGASTKAASYLAWPDARLRAYLREHGVGENVLPTNRPGLLQETRIRWVQTTTKTEAILAKLKDIINSSVEVMEDKISRILEVFSGHSRDIKQNKHGENGDAIKHVREKITGDEL